MTARELDALVAERVMGCKVYRFDLSGEPRCDCPGANSADLRPHGTGFYGAVRAYSSTGDGMLAVVEAMRGKGYDCKILLKDYAHVLFDDGDDDEEWTLADGPHWAHENVKEAKGIPHTVCLAALRAVGVEVPS